MNNYFDRLGLTPQERRLVVFVAAVVFLVLNLWLVWPRFKDWGKVSSELAATQAKIQTYQAEIARTPEYEQKLKALEGAGAGILSEEAANELQRQIQAQAVLSQLTTTGINPVGTGAAKDNQANEFFEERAMRVGYLSGDAELVDFLVSIGSNEANIRVRDLDARPDATQSKLQGSMTLVASIHRKPAATKTAPTKASTTAPASKTPASTKAPPSSNKAR